MTGRDDIHLSKNHDGRTKVCSQSDRKLLEGGPLRFFL